MKPPARLIRLTIYVAFGLLSAGGGHGADVSTSTSPGSPPQLSTIAALRVLAPPQGSGQQQISVSGYSKPNDGGGGTFVWLDKAAADDDGGITIAPSGNTPPGRWVRVLAEPGVVSPLHFGARCDGTGDDAIAINAAINYLRHQRSFGDLATITGILRLPARQCVLRTSVNATGLESASVMIESSGGSLLCQATGLPCIDAMGSGRLGLRDITIYGDQKSTPRIGLQIGRISPRATAAGMHLDRVSISGFFSFAAFYNLNAETQLDVKLNASNQAAGGYGAVWDGYNHWNATSAFINITSPVEQLESFGDNTCLNCRITSAGSGGVPMWAGGTAALTFVNSYISNFSTGVAAVLYNWNINPNFDVHFEAADLTSIFLLSGNGHPVIYGLIYREHDFFAQKSMFALDAGVKAATLENVDINIGSIHGHGTWFDDPSKYTVSGRVGGVNAQGWVNPGGGFSGVACFGTKCVTQ